MPIWCNRNLAVIKTELPEQHGAMRHQVVVASAYFPYDPQEPPPPAGVTELSAMKNFPYYWGVMQDLTTQSAPTDLMILSRVNDGDYAESEEKCLKLLLKTHYSGLREGEEEARPRYSSATRTSWATARKIFTPERIRWAVANLAPYKVPEVHGLHGVYPVFLQVEIELLTGTFTNIFRSSLALGYVPEA